MRVRLCVGVAWASSALGAHSKFRADFKHNLSLLSRRQLDGASQGGRTFAFVVVVAVQAAGLHTVRGASKAQRAARGPRARARGACKQRALATDDRFQMTHFVALIPSARRRQQLRPKRP